MASSMWHIMQMVHLSSGDLMVRSLSLTLHFSMSKDCEAFSKPSCAEYLQIQRNHRRPPLDASLSGETSLSLQIPPVCKDNAL